MMSKQVLKRVSPLTSVWVDEEDKTVSNKKQNSIDWLVQQLKPAIALQEKYINEFLQQAKAMHKEEMFEYIKQKYCIGQMSLEFHRLEFEQYYNETFGGDK